MEKTTPKSTLGESHCTAKDDYDEESKSVRMEDKVKEETVGSIKSLEDFDLCIEIFSLWDMIRYISLSNLNIYLELFLKPSIYLSLLSVFPKTEEG